MPLDESQLEYVDRFAGELQGDSDTGKIKAVGIRGGDLYNELILLRSLRDRFSL